MKALLAILGAAQLASSPASAAIVTYSMVFKDLTGAEVGSGSFSFDPGVNLDIFVDPGTGGPCMPPPEPCIFGARWTPLTSFFAMVGGESVNYMPILRDAVFNGQLFTQGGFFFDPRFPQNALHPGEWLIGDVEAFNIFMDSLNLSDPTAIGKFFALGPTLPGSQIDGTVDFTRLPAIPLPAGLALFASALAAFGAIRWRTASAGDRTSLHGFAS